jgi:hypothetical protein
LSNGLNISPMKGNEQGNQPRSLREAVYAIDNEKDLSNYLSSFGNKVPPRAADIRYERNAVSLRLPLRTDDRANMWFRF